MPDWCEEKTRVTLTLGELDLALQVCDRFLAVGVEDAAIEALTRKFAKALVRRGVSSLLIAARAADA